MATPARPPDGPLLECRGLVRRLRSGKDMLTVLDGIDLSIDAGDFVAVLGPSGSGKSTLLGLLAGLDRPSAGSVLFRGEPLEGKDEDAMALWRRAHLGFVFQSFRLLPHLTALENCLVPLELAGADGARERAEELLERVGLADRGHHYPSQLSGGEQQRVALARAFGPSPALLLADEPTGNLDAATGSSILDLLVDLRATRGTALVLVTHDPEVARRAARRIHLRAGRVEQVE